MAKNKGGGGGGSKPTQTNAGPNPMGKPAPSAPQSMSAQVKAAGAVVSKKEAAAIAKDTGKTVAQVMAKAQDKGQALGSGLVNAYNNNKLGPNTYSSYGGGNSANVNAALQQLQALQGLKLNQGTAYAGYSTTYNPAVDTSTVSGGGVQRPATTTYNPIVLPRNMVGGAGGGGAGGAGGAGGGGNGGGSGGNGNVKNDGTIDSIKSLFEQQMAAAQTQINELSNRQAETINGLTADFSSQLAASQQSADQRIAGLNDLMLQQQDQAASTQALLQQQAQAAQAAYQEQARQADALGRAYVPTLNPSAASASLGDQRTTARQETNNSLSDLAIVSGLGTNTNPLAGLQLA